MTRETKEAYFTRRLHEMKIGEQEKFTLNIVETLVTRVPGGWIMGHMAKDDPDNPYMEWDFNDVFVPISSEGEASAMKGSDFDTYK